MKKMFNWMNLLHGKTETKKGETGGRLMDRWGIPSRSLENRKLRMEELEKRELLAVTAAEFAELSATYSSFNLSSNPDALNIIEVTASDLTAQALQTAVHQAASTVGVNDLILIRTDAQFNSITFGEEKLILNLSEDAGSITMIGYGERSLELIGKAEGFVQIQGGNVQLGGMTLIGVHEAGTDLSPRDLLDVSDSATVTRSRLLYMTRDEANLVVNENVSGPLSTASLGNEQEANKNYSIEFNVTGSKWVYLTGLTQAEATEYQINITAASEEYYVDQFFDANKVWSGDTELCWAGSASDILYYTGWATVQNGFESEQAVFDYYKEYFTDDVSQTYFALDWFITGNYEPTGMSDWAQLKKKGGGAFFPETVYNDVNQNFNEEQYGSLLINEVESSLRNGAGVGITLGWYLFPDSRIGGHAITLWGYTYDTDYKETDVNYYTGLIVTDSDDNYYGTVTLQVEWNDEYKMYNFTNYSDGSGYLESFITLETNKNSYILKEPALSYVAKDDSAVLYWKADNHSIGYQLEYKLSSDSDWTSIAISDKETSTWTLENLAKNTDYDIRIKSLATGLYVESPWYATTLKTVELTGLPEGYEEKFAEFQYKDTNLENANVTYLAAFSVDGLKALVGKAAATPEDDIIILDSSISNTFQFNYVYDSVKVDFDSSIWGSITIIGSEGTNLNGKKMTIDANEMTRLFELGQNVTFNIGNVELKNGFINAIFNGERQKEINSEGDDYHAYGGAIRNEGNLTVVSCDFTENNVYAPASADANQATVANGGAIYNAGKTRVFYSTFNENSASASESKTKVLAQGGAVYTTGLFTAFETTFTGNQALGIGGTGYGGGVNIGDGGTATTVGRGEMKNCLFTENRAAYGAVGYVSSGEIVFTNCILTENVNPQGEESGNIHNNHGIITVADTKIYDNTGSGIGGRFFESGSVLVERSEIYNNSGNGIFHAGTTLVVSDSAIYSNRQSGIYNTGLSLEVSNCDIHDNSDSGIKTSARDFLSISKTTIRDNSSRMYLIDESTPIYYVYAAGLWNTGANTNGCLVKDTDFYNNKASGNSNSFVYGGAIYNSGNLEFENCDVYDNLASATSVGYATESYGGGVYNTGTISFIGGCDFVTNIAESTFSEGADTHSQGGAIWNSGTFTIEDAEMKYNNAYTNVGAGRDTPSDLSYGGAIYNANGGVMSISTLFIKKNASYSSSDFHNSYGSGIYNAGTLTASNTFISEHGNFNNQTTDFGGGIYNSGTLTLTNVEISKNFSDNVGTGVYNNGTLNGRNLTIAGNTSRNAHAGNGIYNGGTVTLENSIIGGNWVTEGSQISGNAPTLTNSLVDLSTDVMRNVFVVVPTFNTDGSVQNYEKIDLHLVATSASPAIDQGTNVNVQANEVDLDGLVRIYNNIVDIGCYEYGSEAPVVDKLPVPGNFQAALSDNSSTITVSWNAVTHADHYLIRFSVDREQWSEVTTDETRYVLDNLIDGATYFFTVTAIASKTSGLGDSDESAIAIVHVTTNKLATPTGVTAEAGASSVTVSWNNVENATGYRLNFSSDMVNWTPINNIKTTSYTVNGLSPELTYYFTVTAVAESHYTDSDESSIVSASPGQLNVPENVKATVESQTEITVSWNAVEHATSYVVKYRKDSETSWSFVTTTNTSYHFTGLTDSAKYWFTVTAIAEPGYKDSNESAPISAQWQLLTVVTTELDILDEFDGLTSLREAIAVAGSTVEGNVVSSVVTFDPSMAGKTCQLTLGELVIDKTITIDAGNLLDAQSAFILDGQKLSRIFNVSGETSDVTMIGLVIQNGQAPIAPLSGAMAYGGGIFTNARSLTLDHCVVTNNTVSTSVSVTTTGNATSYGGGIYANGNGKLTLSWTTVSDNTALASTYCTQRAYRAEAIGGGIYATNLEMTHSTVTNNFAHAVSNENYAVAKGGGIFAAGSIVNSLITVNTAQAESGIQYFSNDIYAMSFGGGVCQAGDLTITNATIAKNSSWAARSRDKQFYSYGGGVCALSVTNKVTINNSIILLNNTSYIQKSSDLPLFDNYDICLYHALGDSDSADSGQNNEDSDSAVSGQNNVSTYQNWRNGSENNVVIDYTEVVTKFGSLQGFLDQFFVDVYNPFDTSADTSHENYRLCPSAVWALNRGDASLAVEANGKPITLDLDEVARLNGDAIDIGAYEQKGTLIVTTNLDVIDAMDGETSLREAILYANTLDEPGTITFLNQLKWTTITLDAELGSLEISKSVTIDAGDLSKSAGIPFLTINGVNLSDSILKVDATASDVTIIGLTWINGSTTEKGGAIYSEATNLTLKDSVFTKNKSIGDGGAVWTLHNLTVSDTQFTFNQGAKGGAIYASGTLDLTNATFAGNSSENNGGAIYASGTLDLTDVSFAGNSSETNGGAIYASGTLDLTDVSFAGNSSEAKGGAIYASGTLGLKNATFTENSSVADGGAIYASKTLGLTNVTFTKNSSVADGGAIYASDTLDLTSATFTKNSSEANGGAIYAFGVITVTDSTFNENTASINGGAIYSGTGLNGVGVILSNNTAGGNGGAIEMKGNTSLLGAVLTNNSAVANGGAIDVSSGSLRIINTQIDKNNAAKGAALYLKSQSQLITNNVTITANGTGSTAALTTESYSFANLYNSIVAINSLDVDGTGIMNAHAVLSSFTDWTNKGGTLYNSEIPLFEQVGADNIYRLAEQAYQAIDLGVNANAVDAEGNPLTTDLTGGNRIINKTVDLGATERQEKVTWKIQKVSGESETVEVLSGDNLDLAISHEVINKEDDSPATTLSLRIHFDSRYLSFDSTNPGTYEKADLTGQGNFTVYNDDKNYDNDSATDRYILVTWNSSMPNAGLWNGAPLKEIFTSLHFTVRNDVDQTQDVATFVRFSAKNITANFEFLSTSIKIAINRTTFDIDGDGIVNISTDANLLLRYMAGKRDAELTENLLYDGSGRKNANEIENYLDQHQNVFDINGDGTFIASIDGELLIRYLAGYRDDNLLSGIDLSAGTRTTAVAIQNFIESYLTGETEAQPTTDNAHVVTTQTTATVISGETFSIELAHALAPNNLTGTTLSLRVYYDSAMVGFNPDAMSYYKNGLVGPTDNPILIGTDNENEDGDILTNSYVQLTWNVESGWTWSSQKINNLLKLVLMVKDQTGPASENNIQTTVHVRSMDRTAGFKMDNVDVTVTILPTHFVNDLWLFDIDGSGTVDIATDGNILLRKLAFPTLPIEVNDLLTVKSTRGTEAVNEYLDKYLLTFDMDGNGAVNMSTDLVFFLKFLADYRGDALVTKPLPAINATRTTGEEIADYIKRFIPEEQRDDPTPASALLPVNTTTISGENDQVVESITVTLTKDSESSKESVASLDVPLPTFDLPIRSIVFTVRKFDNESIPSADVWEKPIIEEYPSDDFVNDETIALYSNGQTNDETEFDFDSIFNNPGLDAF